MKKEDFHKGQTVWIYLVGNSVRGNMTPEERIREWEVVSVGRKYLTARPKGADPHFNTRFEVENNFREHTIYSSHYELYLSKEEILYDIWRDRVESYISHFCRFERSNLRKMTDEDLQLVVDIFKKYESVDKV